MANTTKDEWDELDHEIWKFIRSDPLTNAASTVASSAAESSDISLLEIISLLCEHKKLRALIPLLIEAHHKSINTNNKPLHSPPPSPVPYNYKRLHVSNIPFRYREMDLWLLLSSFGEISDVEIIFNDRGSKGFGFVSFTSTAAAAQARHELNGRYLEGRQLEINFAISRMKVKSPSKRNSECITKNPHKTSASKCKLHNRFLLGKQMTA